MKDFTLEIEYVDPKKLKPYAKNARVHDEEDIEAIRESIRVFGFNDPVGVWGKKNLIVEGHGRQLAAIEEGLPLIPIIHLDHLNSEQQRAYRLAHNKTAELSFWDSKLVRDELKGIGKINMKAFGFSLPDFLAPEGPEQTEPDQEPEDDEEDAGYYGDERERTFDAYNLHDYDPRNVAGPYDLPILRRCDYTPGKLIGFNYLLSTQARDAGIHFFIDDYQFERVWNTPGIYVEKLLDFPCVCTPDFSLYMDMPKAMKIWNVYRSRLIGQIMQAAGMNVIPTLQYAGADTLDWCFDGIEGGGTVAVSTVGVMKDPQARKTWAAGMERALQQIQPKTVVCYGAEIDFDFSPAQVVTIKARSFVE
jgi:hypothetical protein